MNIWRYS